MVTFYGKYTSKLDDKGRLVLPAPLKGALPEGGDMRFVVRKDIFADCLEMYAYPEWGKKWQNNCREATTLSEASVYCGTRLVCGVVLVRDGGI